MELITEKFQCTHRSELKPSETLTIGLVARFRPQKRVDRWAGWPLLFIK